VHLQLDNLEKAERVRQIAAVEEGYRSPSLPARRGVSSLLRLHQVCVDLTQGCVNLTQVPAQPAPPARDVARRAGAAAAGGGAQAEGDGVQCAGETLPLPGSATGDLVYRGL
jgi:hypothetical protein